MQLFVVPRSIPSTFAIIFFSTFFRPPWATQDLSKDRAKHLEIASNPNFQGKYAVTHDTPATLIATNCHIVADLFMLAFHRAACFAADSGYPPKRSGVAEGDVNQGCGAHENETSRAGLRPDGVYVYAGNRRLSVTRAVHESTRSESEGEWGEGRRNRPLSQGEHGCPKQSRTLEGKPAHGKRTQDGRKIFCAVLR